MKTAETIHEKKEFRMPLFIWIPDCWSYISRIFLGIRLVFFSVKMIWISIESDSSLNPYFEIDIVWICFSGRKYNKAGKSNEMVAHVAVY